MQVIVEIQIKEAGQNTSFILILKTESGCCWRDCLTEDRRRDGWRKEGRKKADERQSAKANKASVGSSFIHQGDEVDLR